MHEFFRILKEKQIYHIEYPCSECIEIPRSSKWINEWTKKNRGKKIKTTNWFSHRIYNLPSPFDITHVQTLTHRHMCLYIIA